MLKDAHSKRCRILCFVMSVLIVCGMLPLNALAGEATGEYFTVVFDPNDGTTQYNDFDKTGVYEGTKIRDIPNNPERLGYFFKGWYAYTDENDNPEYWDFENDVISENTTLWADWEEGCVVAFDPNDGSEFNDFYKTTVHKGEKVTDIPEDPEKSGYVFGGWYAYTDEEDNPEYWDFENDVVEENTTLWADWEGCIVAFDPDDGKAQYKDFYKTTVDRGEKITDIPEDPKRDGYLFKGWYAYLDEDGNPEYWDFENDVVKHNTTLWAGWEEGCIVAYDPDDGTQYKNFYKTTVREGEKVTDIPEDPKRDGYFFKGWYAYLDEDGNPEYWDFENDVVKHNITLWAGWEKGCIVAYDPDDGTQYKDFYKTTVHKGEKVTDIPEDPIRDGYYFRGWYAYLDEGNPIYWDFENDVVEDNTTLWAAWDLGGITKSSSADKVAVGETFTYTITVSYSKLVNGIWRDVIAHDVLDDAIDYVSYESEDGVEVEAKGKNLDIHFGDVKTGESKSVTITVKVNENAKVGDIIGNTVVAGDRTATDPNGPEIVEVKPNPDPNPKPGGGSSSGGGSNPGTKPPTTIPDTEIPLAELEKSDHFAYVVGYPDGNVKPMNKITREEVAMIFYRLLTDGSRDKLLSDNNSFTDLEGHDWSNRAISTLFNAGIISGYPDGTFKPSAPITRAEFATIAAKFDELKPEDTTKFTDISGHWADKYIISSENKGWIKGYPDMTFKPEQDITRAEAMTLINNVLGRTVSAKNIHTDATFWPDINTNDWYYEAVMEATNSHNYIDEGNGELWTGMKPNKVWP